MIVSANTPDGLVYSVENYDPELAQTDTEIFANVGFTGWLLKIKNGNTSVNDSAPAKLLYKVYNKIVW
jgi:hypothetical protein